MNWFYLQMLELHKVLAWCSVLIFAVRGLAAQFGLGWAKDSRLLLMIFGVNMLLAVTGLSLWGLLHFSPLRDSWLTVKLLVLVAYALCAHWALGSGEFHVPAYMAALMLLAYAIALSATRQPLLGL